jgi:hypothetical protein
LEQALARKLGQSVELDSERPMRAMIERLEGDWVYCVIQAFVSPDASGDRVKTEILETVRQVLLQDEAFAESPPGPSLLALRSARPGI